MQLSRRELISNREEEDWRQTLASRLLAEYVDFSVTMGMDALLSSSFSTSP